MSDETKELSEEMTELSTTDEPSIEDLSTKQMKAALLMVTAPSMTDHQIATSVARSVHSIRKWKQNKSFKGYLEHQKKKFASNMMDEHVKQTAFIKQKLFEEIVDRVDAPPTTDAEYETALGENYTEREKAMYQKRFLRNMEAKELFKTWGQFDKNIREDANSQEVTSNEEKIAGRLRNRYEEILIIRARREQFQQNTGFDDFVNIHEQDAHKVFEQNKAQLETEDTQIVDAEFEEKVEEETVDILAQYSMEE